MRLHIRLWIGTAAVIALAAAMLCWVPLWNGYPLIFADSSRYLNGGILRYIPREAPIFYGIFMIPLHLGGLSLWPVVVAQCLLLAYVLAATLRALGLFEARSFLALTAFLAAFTAAPWFTAFIMADVFTPICVLAMVALIVGWRAFAPLERLVLIGIALLALSSHVTHLVLGAALAVLFGVRHLLGRSYPRAALLAVLPLPFVALAAVIGMNLAASGRILVTLDGPVYLLARAFADGPAYETMRSDCEERRWQLCKALERLPRDSERFMWSADNSAWTAVDTPQQLRAEASQIVAATVRGRPMEMLGNAARNTLTQLVTFRAAIDFNRWPEDSASLTTPGVIRRFFPHEFDRLMHSRQQQGRLDVEWLNVLYTSVVWLSLAGLLVLLLKVRPAPPVADLLLAVAVALLANAAATGALSVVMDRFQARLIWLMPLCFAVLLLRKQQPDARRIPRSMDRDGRL
jgi:hypothetical protein